MYERLHGYSYSMSDVCVFPSNNFPTKWLLILARWFTLTGSSSKVKVKVISKLTASVRIRTYDRRQRNGTVNVHEHCWRPLANDIKKNRSVRPRVRAFEVHLVHQSNCIRLAGSSLVRAVWTGFWVSAHATQIGLLITERKIWLRCLRQSHKYYTTQNKHNS